MSNQNALKAPEEALLRQDPRDALAEARKKLEAPYRTLGIEAFRAGWTKILSDFHYERAERDENYDAFETATHVWIKEEKHFCSAKDVLWEIEDLAYGFCRYDRDELLYAMKDLGEQAARDYSKHLHEETR